MGLGRGWDGGVEINVCVFGKIRDDGKVDWVGLAKRIKTKTAIAHAGTKDYAEPRDFTKN